MGLGFDRRCVRFPGVDYEALVDRVAAGGSDEEILEWCVAKARRPTEFEIHGWNESMIQRGWRDTDAPPSDLQEYKDRYGLGTLDFHEVDEGRRP